jgi:hypothetical protein
MTNPVFALLDLKKVTIQFGLIHPRHWSIVNPSSMGLEDPTSLLVIEKAAARELDDLDKTKKYSCQVEIDLAYGAPTTFGHYINVFDVKKCVEVP